MAHSVEIRVPLVDVTLLRHVAPLLDLLGASPKQVMAGIPAKPLPDTILNRQKSGFGVPTSQWLLHSNASKGAGSREWARMVYDKSRRSYG
jgi:asparagine synthase (glutamine-hydrolysing)